MTFHSYVQLSGADLFYVQNVRPSRLMTFARNAMSNVEGFILAGGASSRMGTDKAQLKVNGMTFVERIAKALAAVADRVVIVGRGATSADRLEAINDIQPDWGALGGVHAALSACSTPWAAIVACDLPFVTGELFMRLATLREDFDAVAPVQIDGRPQPLCALYRQGRCKAIAEEMIASGERRPRAILQSVLTRWVRQQDIADLQGSDLFFDNINTPDEYMGARKKGERLGPASAPGC